MTKPGPTLGEAMLPGLDGVPADPVAYLQSRGWVHARPEDRPSPRKAWLDPRSVGGKQTTTATKGISFARMAGVLIPTEARQVVTPTAPWYYDLLGAVRLQMDRDRKEGRAT